MAVLTDSILFFLATTLILFLSTGGELSHLGEVTADRQWLGFALNDLLPMLLVVGFWVHSGATPGKQLMDCRVVLVSTGKPPGPGRAVLRYLGYLASLLTLGLGFLWILWDRRRQGLHDKLAGTVVIDSFGAANGDARKSLQKLVKEASYE